MHRPYMRENWREKLSMRIQSTCGDEQLTIGLQALDSRGVVISQSRLTLSIIEDDSMLCVITHSALICNRGRSYTHIHKPLYLPFSQYMCKIRRHNHTVVTCNFNLTILLLSSFMATWNVQDNQIYSVSTYLDSTKFYYLPSGPLTKQSTTRWGGRLVQR